MNDALRKRIKELQAEATAAVKSIDQDKVVDRVPAVSSFSIADTACRFSRYDERCKKAVADFERASSRLYLRSRPSGNARKRVPRYPEEQMKELLRELNDQRNSVLRGVERETRELLREAQREVELAGEFAIDSVLSGSERSDVAARLALVEGDVSALSGRSLEQRLRGVLANGSMVDQFAYLTAARGRQRQLRERQASSASGASRSGNPGAASPAVANITPIDGVVAELEQQVFGEERERRTGQAREAVDEARGVLDQCVMGRTGAKDSFALYMRGKSHVPKNHSYPTTPSSGAGTIARDRLA
jgi:hypothetical protein